MIVCEIHFQKTVLKNFNDKKVKMEKALISILNILMYKIF